jgi:type IV pilus assembly protein PilB
MPVSEPIARLIVDRAPSHDIETSAVMEGMQTLRRTALRQVALGVLSFQEMLRVVS